MVVKLSNGKGDKWRGGWNRQYESNFNKIFGEKMSSTTAKVYLELWLSEQIPTDEWLRILKERTDVNELYQKHLENRNVEYKSN